ncbi:hypothetical protein [Vibrio parahaemolyticus]|uniref:hypothetical protein n=1 Tax=Vibrio parahaemolyticus TaxID=670 RepID=UPI00292A41E9|nr:hypothetical protein [Vibrio parahaemolyticus]
MSFTMHLSKTKALCGGYHTGLMKDVTERANKQWGENPEGEDRKKGKKKNI